MANQPTKYGKFLVGAASAALVATAVAPVASAADFKDTKGNTHEEAINALSNAGVISGYADGTFKPNKTLTRSDVVKMMGKWLVSEGYKVPTDYKTTMRFTDLKSTTNDELLQMAALVKDNGLFIGTPDGKLDAAGDITRENMAVVLVRAFDRVHDIDLATYVAGQEFKKDVTDLGKAKAEARPAIDVLDFFDITNPAAPAFNPKATTTRGQFATFLYKTSNTDFSKVGSGVAEGVASVKAVNNTTVEVTMKDAVENINSLDFKIDGLTVSNAVVKQTDKKVVVLTTAVQKADEKYTVTLNGKAIGSFKGISAVIPTGIKVTTPSIQGKIGSEVIVQAQVTVPDGQSKAGIPVTFNVEQGNSLNAAITAEAVTNADGIASYSYTRYSAVNDKVVVYANGDRSKFSTASVYWANSLTLTQVTEANVLANGAKKVYKIKTDSYATEKDAAGNVLYNYVNVAFAENVDVAPDKLVRGVTISDTGVATNSSYPSQITSGTANEVRVKVNAAGEATFTLTGANAAVTPVVFVDADKNGKWSANELQAAAPQVKFELNHTLGLVVKAEGVQNAAARNAKGTGEGGRAYTVTVTDKDGKVAPAGTRAYVTFEEGNYSTDKLAYIKSGNTLVTANKTTRHEIQVTGTKGEATFTIVGDTDAFAAPTVYLENGKEFGLDKADLQTKGEMTYFVNAVVANATLTIENADGKEVTTLPSTQTAYFKYNSVDQNEFDYYAGTGVYEVSYEVTANFADVVAGGRTVKAGTTETIKVQSVAGKATLAVTSGNVASNVTVNASASQVSLPNKTASIAFTKGTAVPAVYTGQVSSIDTVNNKLTFVGYDAITYSTASFKNKQGVVIDEAAFESQVNAAILAGDTVKVTAHKNVDGTYTLEIEDIITGVVATGTIKDAVLSVDGTQLTLTFDKNVKASSVVVGDFNITVAGAVTAVESVSGDKVVLTTNGSVTTASKVDVAADAIEFTDGTSNAVIAATSVTQPVANKVSPVTQTTKSAIGVTGKIATGKVVVAGKDVTVDTTAVQTDAFNNLVVKFVKSSGNTTVEASLSGDVVTVKLANADATNTIANITTAITDLGVSGNRNFANLLLKVAGATSDDTVLVNANVLAEPSLTIAGGVTAVTAAKGVYTFTLNNNLAVGDKVVVNGKTYLAGTDFVVGSTATVTAGNLVAKIKATDARFNVAGTAAAGTTITLTEATETGLVAPTVTVN